jgi:succinate dehydrogenase / fumarate reductase iron-sulfur subunit
MAGSAPAGDGGIQECGFAQNCVVVCPKQIPLTNAISDVVAQKVKDWLKS